MSSSSSSKGMRLHFKGDKPEKKRKKRSKQGASSADLQGGRKGGGEDGESDVEEVGGDDQAWVSAHHPTDLSGPTLIYQAYTPASSSSSSSQLAALDLIKPKRYYALTLNPTLQKMTLSNLTPSSSSSSAALQSQLTAQERLDLEGAEILEPASLSAEEQGAMERAGITPTEVHQVLVASRVLDSYDPPRYTFRTTDHRFLGADKHGALLCQAEARGPQEEWSLISIPPSAATSRREEARLAFRSIHGTYLSLDEVAGGKMLVRVDSTHIGPGESWFVKVQWKFRHEARKNQQRASQIGNQANSSTVGSAGLGKRLKLDSGAGVDPSRQSYTLGKTPTYSSSSGDERADRKALKRAIREGRVAEELLDRRSKMKSDKFA